MKISIHSYSHQNLNNHKVTSAFSLPSRGDDKGVLLALVSITTEAEIDALNVARFLWNGISDEYTYSEGTILDKIKNCLNTAGDKLKELIKNDTSLSGNGVDLQLSLAAFHENSVYFGLVGDHDIYILHESEAVNISDLFRKNDVITGSTEISPVDLVVLTSRSTLEPLMIQNRYAFSPYQLVKEINSMKSHLEDGETILLASTGSQLDRYVESFVGGVEVKSEPATKDERVQVATPVELPKEEEGVGQGKESLSDPILNQESKSPEVQESIAEKQEVSSLETDEVDNSRSKTPALPLSNVATNWGKAQLIQKFFNSSVNKAKNLDFSKLSRLFAKAAPVVESGYQKAEHLGHNLSSGIGRKLVHTYGNKAWFKRIKAKISQSRISSYSIKGMKLGSYRDNSLRRRRFALAGIGVMLVVGVVMGVRTTQNIKANREEQKKFQSLFENVSSELDLAESKVKSDADSAEIALFNAQKELEEASLDSERLDDQSKGKLEELNGRVLGISDKINRNVVLSEESSNIELFLDGRIDFGDGSNPNDIIIYKNKDIEEHLYIADSGAKAVFKIPTYSKTVQKLPDANSVLQTPKFIEVGVKGIYVFDETVGVARSLFGKDDTEFKSFDSLTGVGREDFDAKSVDEFAIFTLSDNVYVLSQSEHSIFKAQGSDSGTYSLPFVYLDDKKLSNAEEFFGDLSIYVLTDGFAGLNRYSYDYTVGKLVESPVQISGLRQDFQNLIAGHTGPDLTSKLYLFDKDSQRILVFEKPNESEGKHPNEMVFEKQYTYRGSRDDVFTDVKDIVVDSAEKYMYVLDGTKVWKISL